MLGFVWLGFHILYLQTNDVPELYLVEFFMATAHFKEAAHFWLRGCINPSHCPCMALHKKLAV